MDFSASGTHLTFNIFKFKWRRTIDSHFIRVVFPARLLRIRSGQVTAESRRFGRDPDFRLYVGTSGLCALKFSQKEIIK